MFCSLHNKLVHKNMFSSIKSSNHQISASITEPGEMLLMDKYVMGDETVEDRLINACVAFATDHDHASRLAKYIENGWFMFATPLLSNGGTSRGLPISCFLNYVPDSCDGLADHYAENIFLSTMGGGIGSHWSDVRSKGEITSKGSETTGVIPFIKVADSQTVAFNQGKTRRGAYAAYLDVSHPEILEFVGMRSSTGGDVNRKCLNIHHGVNITNEFMRAVVEDKLWTLTDPKSGRKTEIVKARDLWTRILQKRVEDRGEPYLFFIDTARADTAYTYEDSVHINGSNLCTEITLATTEDKTAVCCLSSVNLAKFNEWHTCGEFISDLVEMLDNALEVFINQAPPQLHKAVRSATWERSIGLGMMGLHSYLQSEGITYEDDVSYIYNHIYTQANTASIRLGTYRGIPKAAEHLRRRNTHLIAIAPNASSSIMLGVSPGVEPWRSNCYSIKQGGVLFEIKNPALERMINVSSGHRELMWQEVRVGNGSVQHVDWLSDEEKELFQTAFEINQYDIVEAASFRQEYVDQSQSINLFFDSEASPTYINDVHIQAWSQGLKSLYYCRTQASNKVESTAIQTTRGDIDPSCGCPIDPVEREACPACEG